MRVSWSVALIFIPAVATAGESALPSSLAVQPGEHLVLKARARGVQIYACAANAQSAPPFAWTLKGPEAQLFDDRDKPLGKHYAGPTWEASDGSKVLGEVVAKAPQPNTIPWLLLRAKVSTPGLFAKVTSIQRLDTVGGAAPASGCDEAHLGAEKRVPYSASYAFFAK
jgi:hypothetical protein